MAKQDKWDYIVIGGGTTGCVLANRLSEAPESRVLLIDAGRNDNHLFTRIPAGQMRAFLRPDMNWLYNSEADSSRNSQIDIWPAGKIIGGGSAINGMMHVRGHHTDYDQWEQLGNSGWSYNDVLPFFKKSECSEIGDPEVRGTKGPQHVSKIRIQNPLNEAFLNAAQEIGIPFNADLNGFCQEGVGPCQAIQKNGRRYSSAQAFLRPVLHRKNLKILLQSQVLRILVKNDRAEGIEYISDGEHYQADASRGVVLCAGAIASPKILMLSGIGAEKELSKQAIPIRLDLPGVGKNLQDHPVIRVSFNLQGVRTLTSDLSNPFFSFQHLINYLWNRRGALSTCIGHVQAFVKTRSPLAAPNAQIIFAPLAYELTDHGPKPCRSPAAGVGIGLCRTASRGNVRLRDSDPFSAPIIDLSLLSEYDDIQQLREAIVMTREIFSSPSLARFVIDERKPGREFCSDDDLDNYIRSESGLMYHACGTCKMGNDKMSVVDARLKVHGMDSLWIADASIFPTIPAGNINATCLMVGEKAAHMITLEAS